MKNETIQTDQYEATSQSIVPYYLAYKKLKERNKKTQQIGEGQEKRCFKAGVNRVLLQYKGPNESIKVCRPYQDFYERVKRN